jgi:hypothetical protein
VLPHGVVGITHLQEQEAGLASHRESIINGQGLGVVKMKRASTDLRPTDTIVGYEALPGGHDHRR